MKKNKTYAVFGLGRYGSAVAKELVRCGMEVLAIDMDETLVNAAIADIPYCKCADVTDIEVLKQLGIKNVDVVIIAMAQSLEASVMATMLCKELGVEKVVAKCSSEMNCKILEKVGADKTIFPEKESGMRLAKNLLSSGFIDAVEISKDVSMMEIEVRDEWVGKTLLELNLRVKYSLNVVAIIQNKKIETYIDPTVPLTKEMTLVVIANISKINKLREV
ncbi:MAG: TrkA family potassium uptake protein [Lachnospiraceae bacterium]|nr:TrkA family potassium uptake protein [Lachnospiraceae bacterium]